MLCLVFAFSFSACSKKQGEKKEEKKEEAGTAETVNYTEKWVVEPSIEADRIYSLPLLSYNKKTNHYDVSFGEAYVIEKDGKFGLIDSNGKIVTEMKYDSIETCVCSKKYIVTLRDEGETYSIDSNFESDWRYPHKCESFEGKSYIWDSSMNSLKIVEISDGEQNETDSKALLPETCEISGSADGAKKYALAYGGRLVSASDFENAGVFTGGIAALCKNGKWGYVDSTGKQVIPFEYDAVKGHDIIGRGDTAYECSENYVTVLKGGKWGIFRADGTSVIPCTYSSLTTVHDGRAFALSSNGMWGILCVDEAVSNGIINDSVTNETTGQETDEDENEEENDSQSEDEDYDDEED